MYFSLQFAVKKEGWGGGGVRFLKFISGNSDLAKLKPSGKTLTISIQPGLSPQSSRNQTIVLYWSQTMK